VTGNNRRRQAHGERNGVTVFRQELFSGPSLVSVCNIFHVMCAVLGTHISTDGAAPIPRA
jgi:hypothetical protein